MMRKMLGLFFALVLTVLVFLTIYLQGWNPLVKRMPLLIHFDGSVEGLRTGDDVRVEGVVFGKVTKIQHAPEGGVNVVVELDGPVDLHLGEPGVPNSGYQISVEAFTILGGNFVSIRRGKPGTRLATVCDEKKCLVPLAGQTKPSAFEEIGDVVSQNRDQLHALITNASETFAELRKTVIQMNEGQGTVGRLLHDDELYRKTVATMEEIKTTVAEAGKVVEGMGKTFSRTDTTFGRMINTNELHDEFLRTMTDMRENMRELQNLTKGEGALGMLAHDSEVADKLRRTASNIETISENVKKASEQLTKKDNTIGRLINEDKLYQDAERTLEGVDKVLGRAGRSHVYVLGEGKSYPESELTISKIGVRIEPDETKYFYVGGSFLSLDADGPLRFEKQVEHADDDVMIKFDALAFYRVPWFLSEYVGVKAGLIEGKPGGGLEIDFEPFERFPVHIDFEIRDAYNDLDDEDLDEEIHGPMARVWAKLPLWPRPLDPTKEGQKSSWYEYVLHAIKVFGGASRLQDNPEFLVGIGLEYRDEDIKSLIGLVGAGR